MSLLARSLSPEIVVAPMRRRDVRSGVLDIERHAYPTPWSANVFNSELDQVRDGNRYYAAARQGSGRRAPIVGYGGLWLVGDEAHVTNVAVHPDSRRGGVATHLLVHLADHAIRHGAQGWTLEVRVSSTGAQELYRRFGFVPAGVRTRYYDNVEDAIVMWCHDIQTPEYGELLASRRAALSVQGSEDGR